MKIKYLLEKSLIFMGIFYYYTSTIFRDSTSKMLLPILLIGLFLAGIIIIRYILKNQITRHALWFLFVSLTIFVSAYILRWPNVMWIALLSTPLLNIDRSGYIKTVFYSSSIMYFIVVIMSLIGTLPLEYINFGGTVEERYGFVKYSIGFDGPNQAAFAFYTILLSGFYSYGKNKLFVFLITILTLVVGVLSGSRTFLFCSLLFIISFLIIQNKTSKKSSRILPHLFILFVILSLWGMTSFANNQKINDILTGRPVEISQYVHSDYIPRVFGSQAVYNKAKYQTTPLDNFPIYSLARYGVVGFFGFAILFYLVMKREKSAKIKCIFAFVMIYGLFEAFFDIPAKDFLLPIFLYSVFLPDISEGKLE